VGNQDSRTITMVDVATNQSFDTAVIPNGSILTIGLSPNGSRLYALTDYYGVYVIDTGTRAIVATIPAALRATCSRASPSIRFHPACTSRRATRAWSPS